MKKFKFTIRGNQYDVEINDVENDVIELEVNGTSYKVEVERKVKKSKTPTLVRAKVPDPKRSEMKLKKNISNKATVVSAPLPGTIFKMEVAVGDVVKRGDKLLVMEAMKMENDILSEKDGTISAVKVAVGDSVLQNDVLVEIS